MAFVVTSAGWKALALFHGHLALRMFTAVVLSTDFTRGTGLGGDTFSFLLLDLLRLLYRFLIPFRPLAQQHPLNDDGNRTDQDNKYTGYSLERGIGDCNQNQGNDEDHDHQVYQGGLLNAFFLMMCIHTFSYQRLYPRREEIIALITCSIQH